MEHSDSAKWITEQVSMWINNDGDHYFRARSVAKQAPEELGAYLKPILCHARPQSAPWHLAQELAPNDYDRIDWASVAEDLASE